MIDIPAVSSVATQGASVRVRRARLRGSRPSSESCESVRDAPASGCSVPWNMFSTMNQIAAARAKPPNKRSECRAERLHQLALDRLRAKDAQPDERKHDEVERGHPAQLANIARGTFFSGSIVSPT